MASWIVHLRIAERILNKLPQIHPGFFAIGNIGPDSGIPNETWTQFDPPREVTHFTDPTTESRLMEDLRFYREHLPADWRDSLSSPRTSFLLGYFTHLISDNLWRLTIGMPTIDKFKQEIDAGKVTWRNIKSDWYALDHQYVREHPDCIFWQDFMYTTYDTNFLDFLPEEAIRQSISFIKENYRNPTEQVKEWISASRGKFLSESQMNRFTEYCADYCSDVLEYLLADNLIPVDAVSVINLQCFPPFPAVISANSAE